MSMTVKDFFKVVKGNWRNEPGCSGRIGNLHTDEYTRSGEVSYSDGSYSRNHPIVGRENEVVGFKESEIGGRGETWLWTFKDGLLKSGKSYRSYDKYSDEVSYYDEDAKLISTEIEGFDDDE